MITIPIAFLVILINIIMIPVVVFYFYALYKLFEKCNVKGYRALIPFYNFYIRLRIAGVNWWYVILYIMSFVLSIDASAGLRLLCVLTVIFVHSICSYNLSKRVNNGHNSHTVDFLLLTFLPFIYIPVMAFNQEFTYKEDVEVTPNAYIDELQSGGFQNNDTKKKTAKKKKLCDACGEPLSSQNKFCPNCGKRI